MKTSKDRILTTHVGSLSRSKAVTDVVFVLENGEEIDVNQAEAVISQAAFRAHPGHEQSTAFV